MELNAAKVEAGQLWQEAVASKGEVEAAKAAWGDAERRAETLDAMGKQREDALARASDLVDKISQQLREQVCLATKYPGAQ